MITMSNFIKLSSPWYGSEECEAACRVLNSQVANMGKETQLFEQELKMFLGRQDAYIICVSSCTAALQLALQSVGIKQGDEVLVSTLTFVSTFQAIKALGAIPIPCDVSINTGFIDIEDIKRRITSKTRAIVPVLYGGIDDNIHEIYKIANEYNLSIVEDAAHSFGNKEIIKRNGILCFSFDAIKNLSCTDGGAIACSNIEIANRIKDLRLLGVLGDTKKRYLGQRSWDFDVIEQGWRYHMNNLCAAIGRAQLVKFDQISARRCKYAEMYLNGLNNINEMQLFPINIKTAVPHIFPVIIKNNKRNELQQYLLDNNIGSGVQYKPNHLLSYFNLGYNLPNAEWIYRHVLSIPLHPLLHTEDVEYIIETIRRFFK